MADQIRICGRIIALVALVILVACIQRPKETLEIRTISPMEAIDPINAVIHKSEYRDADKVYRVLALSSGGADGAFGAGVLRGWTQSNERPNFDVVTGVSTGALMAVLAFLGPEYDDMLESLYTSISSKDIFRKKGLGAFGSDSLYDYTPLKKQIESVITEELIAKVAQEHARGRRLYVATTNLDAGELVVWDMGDIANGGRTNPVQHFQKVLRASAAVPGFFPPVYIKPQRGVQLRQAHVDGGVKAPILVSDAMYVSRQKKRQLYMIVNGNTAKYNSSVPISGKLADIAQKSIAELMRELMDDTIYRGYAGAVNSGMKFYMTSIPDSILPSQKSLNFDKTRMRKIFEAGRMIGLNGLSAWSRQPPRLGKFEKIASR